MPRTAAGIGIVSLGLALPEPQPLEFDSVAPHDAYIWRATREFALLGDLLAGVAWGALDYLLVDLPPGAERTLQYAEFLGADTALVLVTTPSALARGVVARSAAALRRAPNHLLGYLENMDGYACAGCRSLQPLFPAAPAPAIGAPCLGRIPFDPSLAAASDRGELLPDDETSPTWRALRQAAAAIRAALEGG
jgi:ATP-binding protein involved in chromosome partitioning